MITEWVKVKNNKGNEYEVKLVFDDSGRLSDASTCPCRYGSFHRYEAKNKEKKWMCRHIIRAYAQMICVSPARARDNLIKMGLIDIKHLVKI